MTPQRGKGCVRVLHSAHPSALALVVVLALALGACGPAGGGGGGFAAEYQVNVADDGVCNSGHCSLREAINAANAHAGLDLIKFDIGGGGADLMRNMLAHVLHGDKSVVAAALRTILAQRHRRAAGA